MKALIAEDEDLERKALKFLLETYYKHIFTEIFIASNGQEALVTARAQSPELIFMDIEMPMMDGIEASRRIRSFDTNVEIIMITAYADFNYAKSSIQNGVLDYLVKPYSVKTLKTVVDKALVHLERKKTASLQLPRQNEDKTPAFVDHIVEYLQEHYRENISLDDIAGNVNLSKYYVCRTFKNLEGESLFTRLQRIRVEKAKNLLKKGLNAEEACYQTGFNDPVYFGKVFKKFTGVPPARYKKL
jgi:YesN/AraC family two-component response regulator